jgi:hypothetical protein
MPVLTNLEQELMTPAEAARWFRRSPSWLRQQKGLLRLGGRNGQPLFHVRVCRAYVLGCLCRLTDAALRRVQIRALAAACGLTKAEGLAQDGAAGLRLQPTGTAAPEAGGGPAGCSVADRA